jgi:hypothetical protein
MQHNYSVMNHCHCHKALESHNILYLTQSVLDMMTIYLFGTVHG